MEKKLKFKGPIRHYMRWPLYLTLLLILINILVYINDFRAGVVMSLGLLIYLGIVIVMFLRLRPAILHDLTAFAAQYQTVEKEMLDELIVPFAVLDADGKVVWGNDAFCSMTGRSAYDPGPLSQTIPDLDKAKLKSMKEGVAESVGFGGKIYDVRTKLLDVSEAVSRADMLEKVPAGTSLTGIYFFDATEHKELMERYEDEKLAVALVYLDNYEEALESVEEVRRSLLIALIDRKITRYFSDFDGIVRKIEKDKYFLIIKKNCIEELKEQRFSILEDVKTVNIGNSLPITLSIGVGLGAASFRQNNEFARIAIEMALGRGGDQAVIKEGSAITYWGGKSLQVEKSTRVKARMKAQALKEFINGKDRVVVMGHKITDVDALGAAIGIYRAGMTLGKPVHIVVNDPTTSIRPLMEGFLDNPDYEEDMFVDSTRAKEMVDGNTVVIVVDTNKPSYTECEELLRLTRTIVVLDHHRRGNEVIDNAVLSYVEPYASSTCEMVAEILQYFSEDLRLRSQEADCLYAGIVIDTNNFITRSGVRTFEAAAYLRRNGADTTRVRKMLRDNIDSYRARAEAVRTAEIYREYFAIGVCPSEGLESPTVVGAQAANELLNIAGVKASFVLTSYHGEIYVSARAIDEVNVQVMMEKLGGGGHLNIAGAQVKSSVEEAREMLRQIIDQFIEEGEIKK